MKIIMKTSFGKQIEDTTMATVLRLMSLMEKVAITKDQYSLLLSLIYDKDNDTLKGITYNYHHHYHHHYYQSHG